MSLPKHGSEVLKFWSTLTYYTMRNNYYDLPVEEAFLSVGHTDIYTLLTPHTQAINAVFLKQFFIFTPSAAASRAVLPALPHDLSHQAHQAHHQIFV